MYKDFSSDKARKHHRFVVVNDAVSARYREIHREVIGKSHRKGKFNPDSEYILKSIKEWESRGGKVTVLPARWEDPERSRPGGSILDEFDFTHAMTRLDKENAF